MRMEHLASRKFSKIIALDHANNFKTFFKTDLNEFWKLQQKFLGGWEGEPDFWNDLKPELSPVELKVCENCIFWAKNLFQKIFSRLFLSPNQSYVKKSGQKGL